MKYLTLEELINRRNEFHRYPSPVLTKYSFGEYNTLSDEAERLETDYNKYKNIIHVKSLKNKYAFK